MAGCCLLASCSPSPSVQSASDVQIVRSEPRCKKLGVVEGVGGSEKHARANAIELASERGATHVRLDEAHPDLEDGMTFVVSAKMWECSPPGEEFPPDGYR
jgi:hypothetical protein